MTGRERELITGLRQFKRQGVTVDKAEAAIAYWLNATCDKEHWPDAVRKLATKELQRALDAVYGKDGGK